MAKFLNFANKAKIAQSIGRRKGELCPFVPGTAGDTTSTVEVSISCKNLPNKDLLSKSDPMAVVLNRPPGSRKWVPMMRTEVIYDDLNPEFVTKLVLEYRFEHVQALRFEIYDIDSKSQNLTRQDLLGFCECTLGQIVSPGEVGLTLELSIVRRFEKEDPNRPFGTITLIAEEIGSEKDEALLKLCGQSCGRWRFIIPPKTYFCVYKCNDAGNFVICHRSKDSVGRSPSWQPMKISCRALCNGDFDRQLRIDVYQKHINVGRSLVGSLLTTLNKLMNAGGERLPLVTATGGDCKATVRVQSCTIQPMHTFVDYVQSGMQIQTIFAIDFTCSNGDPSDMQSLHYLSPGSQHPNPYEQAIQAVGNIMKDYDSTSQFPAYGFGARIPPKGDISYDFPLTLTKSPNCCSIPGVIEQYRSCIQKCQLYGPTYFQHVIKTVSNTAARNKNGEMYYILVIVTDGVITDMAKTKKALVDASTLPMSIIIIGVGEADFDAMEELDSDGIMINYRRKAAVRDIVQFVAYRSSRAWLSNTGEATATEIILPIDDLLDITVGDGTAVPGEEGGENPPKTPGSHPRTPASRPKTPDDDTTIPNLTADLPETFQERTNRLAQGQLAAEVLAEIPEQIISYMQMKNILPENIAASKKAGKNNNAPQPTEKTASPRHGYDNI